MLVVRVMFLLSDINLLSVHDAQMIVSLHVLKMAQLTFCIFTFAVFLHIIYLFHGKKFMRCLSCLGASSACQFHLLND